VGTALVARETTHVSFASETGSGRSRVAWLLPLAIAALAFVVRWQSVQHSGGLHALLGYDEGVYFGAATSFVSGLMPYRDFVLVHPPGSVVLLSPFGLLGKLTSDSSGWAAARIFVMLLGALNTAAVFIIARRISLVAAIVAGGLYAVWAPVVHVERTTMLEAFVLTSIVAALWALRSSREVTWRVVLAGSFLGLGAATKLWGLVPLAVVLAWLLVSRAWRTAAVTAASAVVAFSVIVIPFAIADPHRMFDLVIRAQLGRGRGGTHELDRLSRMFAVDVSRIAATPRLMVVVGLVALVVVIAAMALAWWKVPQSRLWIALLTIQLIVLMAVPVYFEGYSSFIAPALMLVVGTTAATLWSMFARLPRWPAGILRGLLVAVLVLVALASGYRALHSGRDLKPHLAAIGRITHSATCVGSDSAGLLVITDTLTRNIERGCPTVLDFDGMVYSFDDGANPGKLSSTQRRRQSARYQQAMHDYFAANDVLLIHRAKTDVLDPATRRMLLSRPVLHRQPGLRVFGPLSSSPAPSPSSAAMSPSSTD
jgi:alpha-1,2-mannosyltransferase